MERTTVDELAHIQAIWPRFEQLVGLRGRMMYSGIDVRLNTYTVCTPLKDRDRPDSLGFAARHIGRRLVPARSDRNPPQIYERMRAGWQS
jgi:hypothetical protein